MIEATDSFHLQRFLSAQEPVFKTVASELKAGRKLSHWMWFIFPQIIGLGRSPMAVQYSITCAAEARAYLAHPILGPRLEECVQLVLRVDGRTAQGIFGNIDAIKLRSCLTLFASVSDSSLFDAALDKYFDGQVDPTTLNILRKND
ncbi:MAG: DUF1810 domain-containing protein [bacterium]